jgi:hypothetical protein
LLSCSVAQRGRCSLTLIPGSHSAAQDLLRLSSLTLASSTSPNNRWTMSRRSEKLELHGATTLHPAREKKGC